MGRLGRNHVWMRMVRVFDLLLAVKDRLPTVLGCTRATTGTARSHARPSTATADASRRTRSEDAPRETSRGALRRTGPIGGGIQEERSSARARGRLLTSLPPNLTPAPDSDGRSCCGSHRWEIHDPGVSCDSTARPPVPAGHSARSAPHNGQGAARPPRRGAGTAHNR